MNSPGKASVALALVVGAGLLPLRPAAAQKTYIAVGDSLAYGFKSLNPKSANFTNVGTDGQPGYVTPYAEYLSAQTGMTYSVINLGIVGETSDKLGAAATSDGNPNAVLNGRYGLGDTQIGLLNQSIAAAGSQLGVITVQIGANDVLQGLSSSPDPFTAYGNALAAIANVGVNDHALLSQIQTDEGGGPLSNVTLLGYYDPYAELSGSSPYASLKSISAGLTMDLNSVIAQEAQAFGAHYVDLYTPFSQHYADYDQFTLANSAPDTLDALGFQNLPNDHPTDLGYALIAQTLEAPEPSAFAGLAVGALSLGGLLLRARRRRA